MTAVVATRAHDPVCPYRDADINTYCHCRLIETVRMESTALNPNDPFEAALIPIVEMNRRKRADYALDGDPFTNFDATSRFLSIPRWMSPMFNVVQKTARVQALWANRRMDDPNNEAVGDTVLDAAVYGVIAYAIYLYDRDHADHPEVPPHDHGRTTPAPAPASASANGGRAGRGTVLVGTGGPESDASAG